MLNNLREAVFVFMQLETGSILEGKVTGITKFGAFVELPGGRTGMVHISEVAATYVKEIRDFVTENQMVKVKILNIGEDGKISLSMKRAVDNPPPQQQKRRQGPRSDSFEWNGNRRGNQSNDKMSFEDMLNKFKQTSDEKMSDLKRVTESKRGSGGYGRRGGGSRG